MRPLIASIVLLVATQADSYSPGAFQAYQALVSVQAILMAAPQEANTALALQHVNIAIHLTQPPVASPTLSMPAAVAPVATPAASAVP